MYSRHYFFFFFSFWGEFGTGEGIKTELSQSVTQILSALSTKKNGLELNERICEDGSF